MKALLEPRAIAVVGASQKRGRGTGVVANLRDCGFKGDIFAVNPRYDDVLGYKCFASVADLPESVDCIVVAVGADAACDVLDQAHAKGIPAAVVLAAGFGEGGHGEARALRLQSLAAKGMCICGPNCFGLINLKSNVAAFSGPIPRPLRVGSVAIVSQSGGLGASAFTPLMADRELGFGYFVSCGNQLGATIEDFVAYFVDDPDVDVIAIVVEGLKNPQKLAALARKAHAQRKSLLLYQAGRSAAGQAMIRSHTGALAGNAEVLAAFLRRCGIVQVTNFDVFVETIALFATAPLDETIADDVVVVSGSGGGAAIATDVLDAAGLPLAEFEPATKERLRAVQPEFGSVTNPIDGTGAMYDDATLLPKIFDALVAERRRPVIAASVSVRAGGNESMRRLGTGIATAARASGRTFVAFQYTPLGGPLDSEMIGTLHAAGVPVLLGTTNTMQALRYLPMRRDYWLRAATGTRRDAAVARRCEDRCHGFGFPELAQSADGLRRCDRRCCARALRGRSRRATAPLWRAGRDQGRDCRAFCIRAMSVACALAARTPRRSRRPIVRLFTTRATRDSRRLDVLVQPMVGGVAEAYAGVIDDPLLGPAICFGLGGVFVEIFSDVRTEMAPLSHDDAAGHDPWHQKCENSHRRTWPSGR